MATYIQGQTDYISQIQPTEPNLAFDAQVLQTKQTKYDANHKKVSELYGSLLNSAMTRTDNIQARDEFFKIINDDIKKMGGLDFSLDQNVQAAAGVFQSIYTNNNIVKDMVWTKNYNEEESRGQSFKNCIDEEKCGGTYWEEGDRYMQYKKNEFKSATAEQALGMGDVRYIPYKNVMKASIKIAKDAGLNVELDKISGDYKITTKNGELIRTPLTTLFSETLGKDPAFSDMFKAKAYVNRNDWAMSKVNMGEFKDMSEANLGYLQNVDRQNKAKLDETLESVSLDVDHLNQKVADYEIEYKKGGFKEGSDKYKEYVQLVNLQNSAIQAKDYTAQVKQISEMKNNQMAIQTMAEHSDDQNAFHYFNAEINDAVNTLAYKDAKQTMTADDFAKMKTEHAYKKAEMALAQTYDIANEKLDHDNAIALEDHKKKMGHSNYDGDGGSGTGTLTAEQKWIETKNAVDASKNSLDEQYRTEMKKQGFQKVVPTPTSVAQWYANPKTYASNIKDYEKTVAIVNAKHNKLQRDANEAAVKAGEIPINRDVVTAADIDAFGNTLDFDYATAWSTRTYNNMKAKYPKLTLDVYNSAIRGADKTKPLVGEIDAYLDKKYQTKKLWD